MSINTRAAKTRKNGIAHVVRPAVMETTVTVPTITVQRFADRTLYYVDGKAFDMVGLLISALSWMDPTINTTDLYYALCRGEYTADQLHAILADVRGAVDESYYQYAFECMLPRS